MNKLMLNMMGAFAEFERNLIHERQAEGIATAKNKDVKFGKTSKVTPDQVLEVKTMGADRYSKIGNCQIRSEPLHFSLIKKLTAHLSGFLSKSCLPASNCALGW
jgi:DNA invertase Pin-like site-specific DNA recombinase